ncbi:MAG: hypothetical protein ORN85_03055 [Sediminibacterium sp.]|nr:hypothetical protein [Sediminibacterium sp.]
MGKTSALNDNDLHEFVQLQITKPTTDKSWTISVNELSEATCDLSVKNPNKKEEITLRSPLQILNEMKMLDDESADILANIKSLI